VVDGIQSQYQQALGKENKLQDEMNQQRAETLNLNDAAAQFAILQRDVDTNRDLYNAIQTRLKDVAVTSGAADTNVSVINSAEVPGAPTSPNKARELMMALVAGLGGGVGLAFLLELIDTSLKNPEEAEEYLRLPSLGLVPDFTTLNGKRSSYLSYGRRKPPEERSPAVQEAQGSELVSFDNSYSVLGEAYRNLRTAVMLSRAGAPPQVTLITSAVSGEGKTVTAVNSAAMLAHLGRNTLLIDADLRRSRCHRVLHIENHLGLTEVLTGSRELGDMIRETEISNLDMLSSGSIPPNPAELLNSQKMADTLSDLRDIYDFIVIDSSPVLPVSDALVLAKLVDGIIVVANGAATPRQQVRTACARIVRARGKILGVVLNKIKINSPDYYYHYHHEYYGYGRAEGASKKGEPSL
jgi:capsular exopolysaccharide synthesis family protein